MPNYKSGIEIPKVNFANVAYQQIAPGSYFIGFNLGDGGKLSKMDNTGAVTVIEGSGGGGGIGATGPKGDPGETLSVLGTVVSPGDLPTSPTPSLLDTYFSISDGSLYVYDPTSPIAGAVGPPGWVDAGQIAGPAGRTVLNGTGTPSSQAGVDGDFYINTTSSTIFGPKAGGAWPASGTSLIGADGKSVLNGTSNPTGGIGNNGDFYINTSTNFLFGPKALGSWPGSGISIVGNTGPAGATGPSQWGGITGPISAQADLFQYFLQIKPRVLPLTNWPTTPTINTDLWDAIEITSQGSSLANMTNGLLTTSNPGNFQKLIIRFLGPLGIRTITSWGSKFAARGAALPTQLTASKITTVGLIWNSTNSTWDCVAVAQEI